jgi:hypothetical protein|tara:strand:- start:3033 stop:3986 length:954 start_codon:yes stop_codon:yes gene_type:complete
MVKKTITVNPEFGCELALAIPYAYWLHQHDKLERVVTSIGMKPFYYFCDDIEEKFSFRTVDNAAGGLNQLPNNWIHHNSSLLGKEYGNLNDKEKRYVHGNLDYSQWSPPPYREYYSNNEYIFEKPAIVVSNKISMDHGKEPHSYFNIKTLYEIFNYLNDKGYNVIYKRPKNEFPIDQNEAKTLQFGYDINANVSEIGLIDDFNLVSRYDNVFLIDDFYKDKNNISGMNETQLKIFSNAKGFISIAGGNGIFCSYFGKTNVTYVTTSGELRDGYFDKNSYYRKLSGCDIVAIIDHEDEIINRGYNDYERLIQAVKENF